MINESKKAFTSVQYAIFKALSLLYTNSRDPIIDSKYDLLLSKSCLTMFYLSLFFGCSQFWVKRSPKYSVYISCLTTKRLRQVNISLRTKLILISVSSKIFSALIWIYEADKETHFDLKWVNSETKFCKSFALIYIWMKSSMPRFAFSNDS